MVGDLIPTQLPEKCSSCDLRLRVEQALDEATLTRHEMTYFAQQLKGVVADHEKELRSVVAKLSELVLGFHAKLDRYDQTFSQFLEQIGDAVATTRVDKKRREKLVDRRSKP